MPVFVGTPDERGNDEKIERRLSRIRRRHERRQNRTRGSELVKRNGNESFALLECEDGIWRESYFDGIWVTYEPIEVDGMKVYALGADEWPWDL